MIHSVSNARSTAKFLTLALLLSLSAAADCGAGSKRCTRSHPSFPVGGSLFDVVQWGFDDMFDDYASEYHRDVMEHFNSQYHCAHLCASRNREIRQSSITNAVVSVSSEAQGDIASHTVKVVLPKVDVKDVKVTIIGDTLKIQATREWTDDLLPKPEDKTSKCSCRDVAAAFKGKEDKFERQLRLPKSVARDKIRVELSKESGLLTITVPEKEPETLQVAVLEVSSMENLDKPKGDSE
ncbi:hypothetical protein AAMO2058_001364200 [Amorphochlora amoebiformis]|mmetsp:Transcript_16324/g.25862  ORF Transcript_16324/g.25862 Transcript_16324/m.25862 type:complete len:238 (-) Transcript_16324:233-946(-)